MKTLKNKQVFSIANPKQVVVSLKQVAATPAQVVASPAQVVAWTGGKKVVEPSVLLARKNATSVPKLARAQNLVNTSTFATRTLPH